MKRALLPATLVIGLAASAQTYLSAEFDNSIPSTFTLDQAQEVEAGVYDRIGDDANVSWFGSTISLSGEYGNAALAPTRNADPLLPGQRRMILPAVHIAEAGAVVRWYARSVYHYFPETYDVLARRDGDPEWSLLYRCEGETPDYSVHALPLDRYLGSDIEIAFVATTAQGFMLAVDNIFVGVPQEPLWVYESHTLHYVGVDDEVSVSGRLTNYGAPCDDAAVTLYGFGQSQMLELGGVGLGESVDVKFDVQPALGKYNYELRIANYEYGNGSRSRSETPLVSDFMVCSHFERTHVIDRASGTWCNNCPIMDLTTSRLKRLYGAQLVVPEVHIRDILACSAYNEGLIDEYVFSIPVLIPDHDTSKLIYKVPGNGNFSANFDDQTICLVKAEATAEDNGDVRVTAQVQFAAATDNSADRYRIAYVLLGDVHFDGMKSLNQELLSWTNDECYYYMASPVKSDLMFYDDLPVNGDFAYDGAPLSLPADIPAYTPCSHSISLSVPSWPVCNTYRALAMVVDTQTHLVLNAALAEISEGSSIGSAIVDTEAAAPEYYDITGRRVTAGASGLTIRRCGSSAEKIYIR